jgi:hypothetical protein
MFLYTRFFCYIHCETPTWCMLADMNKHEEYIVDGFPLDAFADITTEPWPPFKTEQEEAKYWHDQQGEQA